MFMLDLTFLGALAAPFSAFLKAILVFMAAIFGLFGTAGCILGSEGSYGEVGFKQETKWVVFMDNKPDEGGGYKTELTLTSSVVEDLMDKDDPTEDEGE